MFSNIARISAVAVLAGGLAVGTVSGADAWSGWGGRSGGSGGSGGYSSGGPYRAVSYINPDTGAATANPDVDPGSSCDRPDQQDTQRLSDPGTANRNVHNDACLFGGSNSSSGEPRFDGPVSWETTGTGMISACPDPDGAGPKTAALTGNRCFQSGFQTKGMAGDTEYHIRLNNSTTPGAQVVTFCYDPGNKGCADAKIKSSITIKWVS